MLLWMAATTLSGCGFIASTNHEDGSRIYGGVRYDIEDFAIKGFPLGVLVGLIDFPFSVVADTLFLPVTIGEALSRGEPAPTLTVIDGFVIEADQPGVEVVPSGPLPVGLKPLPGAEVMVAQRAKSTESWGYFSLRHPIDEHWESIRVECAGFDSVTIDAAKLRSFSDAEYWKFHSLLVRMKKH
jgi:uncharacterized protein YceK